MSSRLPVMYASLRIVPRILDGSTRYTYSQLITGAYARRNFTSSLTQRQLQQQHDPKFIKNIIKHSNTSNPVVYSSKHTSVPTPTLSKSILLAQTTNRFSRFLIHLKWPLTRNNRPFSLDDFSAFASWVVMGNLIWFILGTTTFVLFGMYLLHSVNNVWGGLFKDEESNEKKVDDSFVGNLASGILSHGLGIKVEFQRGSVLPELHDGMLRFKNINIVSAKTTHSSPSQTAITDSSDKASRPESESESNQLTFKANVEQMDLSLSFGKWYDGNGLIDELEIYGMNCKVYRKRVVNSGHDLGADKASIDSRRSSFATWYRYNESANFSHDIHDDEETVVPTTSSLLMDPNYSLSHFKIHDSYFEIYDKNSPTPTPLKITIFNCDLPELNGNKLLIDFFNANNVTGAVNDSMFTIHKHQKYHDDNENKMVRFKLDGIDMGKISKRNPLSKFNWIVNGRAEIVADILLPQENLTPQFPNVGQIFSEAFNDFLSMSQPDESSNTNSNNSSIDQVPANDNRLLKSALTAIYDTFSSEREQDTEKNNLGYVVVNFKIKLYDLKASLPQQLPMASTSSLPFLSLHNLRMLITFINNHFDAERKPPLIIKTQVIERFSDLYNTSNLTQTRLFDLIVSDIYEDLSKMVELDEKRIIHERQNMWSHTIASQLLLLGLGVIA
ncbi:mitochondrial distribution and morphology protein 31 [[Candida] railenensis]|uniref:Mitochondrial distribution and morphology protein 31 n=1 Tax=[Candida] railenensis TaxID=45579 RepID=A0A9P0W0T1_9ASCO|nr:mitochondrial distribution and morphology protein 31 [[Candida] railenensis]